MSTVRHRLFDLAVNRASEALGRIGADREDRGLRDALEVWYLKTRFANRVPFEALLAAVARRPPGEAHWAGGPDGGWRAGSAPER